MPIEIRELVIRATVDPQATGNSSGSCGLALSRPDGIQSPGGGVASAGANDDLVQLCVREVMRILEEKQER